MAALSEAPPQKANSWKVSPTAIAEPFRAEIAKRISTKYPDSPPKLVGFLANSDPAAKKYAQWTGKACTDDKIQYELREVDSMNLEKALHEANADPTVHGIIIYYPVFGAEPSFYGGSMDDYLRDSISPEKDVEGLCHLYRSNLYRDIRFMDRDHRLKCILPCTPLSVVKIIESQGLYDSARSVGSRLQGKFITVINRSEIVGRPLAALLANDGATVYSIDIDSVYKVRRGVMEKCDITHAEACKKSQIVVLGVPVKSYKLDPSCIQPGTLVINVASFKNVDSEALGKIEDVKFVSAVGKVTVAMLERNLLRLYENFHRGVVESDYPPVHADEDLDQLGTRATSAVINVKDISRVVVGAALVCAASSVLSLFLTIRQRSA